MRQGGVLAEYDPGSLFCEMLRLGEPSHPALSLLRRYQVPVLGSNTPMPVWPVPFQSPATGIQPDKP